MKVNWSDQAIPVMRDIIFDWSALGAVVTTIAAGDSIVPAAHRAKLAAHGVTDAAGRLTIPVIDEREGGELHARSAALADALATGALTVLPVEEWVAVYGFADASQALVVGYHELMWDLMEHWESAGFVTRPLPFRDPRRAGPQDVAALVFAVRAGR